MPLRLSWTAAVLALLFPEWSGCCRAGCASWVLQGLSQLTGGFWLPLCTECILLSSCSGTMNLKFHFKKVCLVYFKGLIFKVALSVLMNNNLGFLPAPLICFSPVVLSPAVVLLLTTSLVSHSQVVRAALCEGSWQTGAVCASLPCRVKADSLQALLTPSRENI